ncbi:OmpA family protein [Betaproteobacteria bacterium SCN1]|jgi:OOP family OmpA-OmpF porin|nr:OmpA family protein [Betaproteobacteria bacterium SCN1]
MKPTRALWLLAGLAALGTAANAAEMPQREFGLLFGGGWADKDLVGGKDDDVNPLFGLRYGQSLNDSFNFFGDLVYGPYDGNRAGVGDADVTTLRGGLEWLFSKQQRYNWFLSGGMGLMNVNTDNGPDFTRPMASLGVGQAWEVGANDAFRWEVRADQSFGNSSLPNAGLTNIQALLGYSWGIGAPADSDGDGVPNRLDQCPNTPKGAKVDTKGCPIDSDGDGVFDGLDKCPDTPAGVKVNADGCPLDGDGDGIPDYKDKCPTVPAPGTADGCPPDRDGDGIVDANDACPDVPAPGTADGCPPKAAEPVVVDRKLTLEGVNFDNDSSNLRPESLTILDKAVETLKAWGDVKVEVAGHTDSVSSDAYNLDLSQRRAETVRAYLIDKGVAADRLSAKGYGESQPVADNKTEEGRFKNRRVELIPQQ